VPDQLDLFAEPAGELPDRLGHALISVAPTKSILTKASGFMADYDYTLNPYAGCSYGCTYCYAAFFARSQDKRDHWGEWVEVKENALAVLRRMRTNLSGKTVYMSSVTDPYQPIERRARLVRALLEELAPRGVRLVVQTRSPLVTRDIDLLGEFSAVRVNMTITSDSEDVRRAFEPHCPANSKRLDAIAEVAGAGLPTAITMTPLLPIVDAATFADRLLETGVGRFVVQPFHADRGKFVAGTRDAALRIERQLRWDAAAYRRTVNELRNRLPELREGKEGFAPE
jgi:DNA repair photolyase